MSTISRYTLEDGSQVNEVPADYTGWLLDNYGNKAWYQDGKYHRLDGPAFIQEKGNVNYWFYKSKRHRIAGPAYYDQLYGYKIYYIHHIQILKISKLILIINY
jgi:hypothetical protein